MPMDKKRYPPDWKRIATEIKEAAGWKCQKCGKQCRRPGEPFDTHKRTLTVAHLNPRSLKNWCHVVYGISSMGAWPMATEY